MTDIPPWHTLSPHQKRDLVAPLWQQGLSTAAIGARLHMTKSAVCGIVHRQKLPARGTPIPFRAVRVYRKPAVQPAPVYREPSRYDPGVPALINAIGGPAVVARSCGVVIAAVEYWKRVGRIPHWHYERFVAAAEAAGVALLAPARLPCPAARAGSTQKPGRDAAIITMLRSGGDHTFKDVADAFGISGERVRQIANRNGVTARDINSARISGGRFKLPETLAREARGRERRAAAAARKALVLSLRDQGHTQVEIAQAVGISQKGVSCMLIRVGRRTLSRDGGHNSRTSEA